MITISLVSEDRCFKSDISEETYSLLSMLDIKVSSTLIYLTIGIPRVICILDDDMYGMTVLIGLTTTSSLKENAIYSTCNNKSVLVGHVYYLKIIGSV